MRTVFIGASDLAITTARTLLKRGHEVVIIERDKSQIDSLAAELDCGFIHGDGSKPVILQEADPAHTNTLFALTNSDQTNIIASLVARSLGYGRVVTKVVDSEFEHICLELGLEDTIIPSRTIGRYLADLSEGRVSLEMSPGIPDEARFFSFVVRDNHAGEISALDLPRRCRVICIYRDAKLVLPEADTTLKVNDEVVLILHEDQLEQVKLLLGQPETGNPGTT
jgi:trk system potassium uptake protein TrkA